MTIAGLCASAESALLAGHGERATELLDQAMALASDPTSRTDVLCLRSRLVVLTGDRAAVLAELRAEAAVLERSDRALAARVLLEAVVLMLYDRYADCVATGLRAFELASDADPLTRARAESLLGLAYVFAGDPVAASRHLASSTEVIRLGGPPQQVVHLLQQIVVGLSGMERYVQSMALCRQFLAAVRSVGADGLMPLTLCLLSNTAYFTSEFDAMEMSATEALALAEGQGQAPTVVFARCCLGLVLAVRGEFATAREHIQAALLAIPSTGMQVFYGIAYVTLAMVELGAGRWHPAAQAYADLRQRLPDLPTLPGILHFRADEIEALWRSGERAAAETRLAEFQDALAGEGPWEHATAMRVAALLAADERADALFAEAITLHEQSPSTFERARTQLCWGEWLAGQRRGEAAAEHLSAARTTFGQLGARPWADRAGQLLNAVESVPTSLELIATPSEVAVAAGRVTVRAFGPLTLVRGTVETRVAMDIPGRALRYLVAAGGSVHAEQLIDELWPDAAPGHGGTRLRTVLSRTRARYGPLLVRDGSVIRWADEVEVDAQRFAELARAALSGDRDAAAARTARDAVRLYCAELMPLDRYSDFAVSARERMRQRYLALLNLLVDDAVERDELTPAIGYARDCVEADPLDETGYVRLARLLLDAERPTEARDVIARAMAAGRELGLAPCAALVTLERRVGSVDS